MKLYHAFNFQTSITIKLKWKWIKVLRNAFFTFFWEIHGLLLVSQFSFPGRVRCVDSALSWETEIQHCFLFFFFFIQKNEQHIAMIFFYFSKSSHLRTSILQLYFRDPTRLLLNLAACFQNAVKMLRKSDIWFSFCDIATTPGVCLVSNFHIMVVIMAWFSKRAFFVSVEKRLTYKWYCFISALMSLFMFVEKFLLSQNLFYLACRMWTAQLL